GRRIPVRTALDARIRRHTRRLRRGDRPATGIEAARPIDLYEGLAGEKLPRPAIQNIEEAVAIAPEHQLARAAVPIRVGQDRYLHRVIVVGVVRRELEVPLHLARVSVQREYGIRVEIVAEALNGVKIRAGIAGTPVGQI